MRAQLPASSVGSALAVLPCFGSAQGLAGNIRAKVGAELGCACSSLVGNRSCLAPWVLSLPVPGAASLNLRLCIPQALPDIPCNGRRRRWARGCTPVDLIYWAFFSPSFLFSERGPLQRWGGEEKGFNFLLLSGVSSCEP